MINIKFIFSKIIKKLRFPSVKNSIIDQTSKVEAGSSFIKSTMGRYSFCGYDCDVFCADIGNFTSIASGVILGGARHPVEWMGMSPVFYKGRDSVRKKFSQFELPPAKRVSVGSDVWIGRNAIVISGASIGDGAVVGAGAVVTKDVPAYAIVAGNPAKLIRYRFGPDKIKLFLEKKWWNRSDEEIQLLANVCIDTDRVAEYMQKKL